MKLTETDRIRLRALEPYDIDLLYKWENDSDIWNSGPTIAPFSRKLLVDYIENYNPDIFSAKQLRLMIERISDGEVLGTVDIYDFDVLNRRAMLGYLIDREHRGCGYGVEAIGLVADYCKNHVGMHQLAAIVAIDNISSRTVLEKNGFTVSGRLRSWIVQGTRCTDAFIYQKLF